jgi:hypothetical protein
VLTEPTLHPSAAGLAQSLQYQVVYEDEYKVLPIDIEGLDFAINGKIDLITHKVSRIRPETDKIEHGTVWEIKREQTGFTPSHDVQSVGSTLGVMIYDEPDFNVVLPNGEPALVN